MQKHQLSLGLRLNAVESLHAATPAQVTHISEMIAGVAHELNNSVGIVLGHVQLLKLRNQDESMKEGLFRIEKSIIHSARLIRKLYEYTNVVGNAAPMIVELSEISERVVNSDETDWRSVASDKDLSIAVRTAEKEVCVSAEPRELVTAMSQLLKNAVENSINGGTIDIEVTEVNNLAKVNITDRGKGIPDDLRHKIYEPFFSTKGTRGSGLGLTIVQSIIARQGGRVSFKNNESGGATFTLTLPSMKRLGEHVSDQWKSNDQHRTNILIVDDDEEICNVLHDMLAIEGFQPFSCADADSAMKALEKNRYHLMITDLSMPGMSGFELASFVQENYPDVEIVLLTGWGNSLLKEGNEMKGIKAVLPKPFRLEDVLRLVCNE